VGDVVWDKIEYKRDKKVSVEPVENSDQFISSGSVFPEVQGGGSEVVPEGFLGMR